MIFYLRKKRRKPACLRDMAPIFGCGGPSSSCCLWPLPPGSRCLAFALQKIFQLFLTLRGKLLRQSELFSRILTLLLFQYVPCAGKGWSRLRPLPHTQQGWRGPMVAAPEEQVWGLPCTPWHLAHHPASQAPPEGSPFPSRPSLGCLSGRGCSSCARAVLGTQGAFCKAQCRVWAALPMGRAETQPSLFLIEVFVYTQIPN